MKHTKMEVNTMMNELNRIWKMKTGKDLTEQEAWKMIEVVKAIMENADKNLDEEIANMGL